MNHTLSEPELSAGLTAIQASPKDLGRLEMIVVRPNSDERAALAETQISARGGIHGDRWADTFHKQLPDGSLYPDTQVTLMNSRTIALLAGEKDRWPLAGDQLYVDLDLSEDNLPAGTRLAIGTAVLEITAIPHTGCSKFSARFGPAALAWVNSAEGRRLHLRGIYAKIVQDGAIHAGDAVRKM